MSACGCEGQREPDAEAGGQRQMCIREGAQQVAARATVAQAASGAHRLGDQATAVGMAGGVAAAWAVARAEATEMVTAAPYTHPRAHETLLEAVWPPVPETNSGAHR